MSTNNPQITRSPRTMSIVKEVKAVEISWKPTNQDLEQIVYSHMVAQGMIPAHDENLASLTIEDGHVVIKVATPTEDLEVKPIRSSAPSLAAA